MFDAISISPKTPDFRDKKSARLCKRPFSTNDLVFSDSVAEVTTSRRGSNLSV